MISPPPHTTKSYRNDIHDERHCTTLYLMDHSEGHGFVALERLYHGELSATTLSYRRITHVIISHITECNKPSCVSALTIACWAYCRPACVIEPQASYLRMKSNVSTSSATPENHTR